MPTLLLRDAKILVTQDETRRRIPDGGLFVRNGVIEQVGPTSELPETADRILDGRDMVVLPGLVNTHHHLYQTLTRALPATQDATLFAWLQALYPVWGELTDEAIYVSALIGLAELLLSGCTTTTDHLYLFPNDSTLDAEVRAATELGIRFHPTRGSMSLGQSRGGLPPDRVVQDEETILSDCERVIHRYHHPERYAMLRVGLAPCSPFSVTPTLMRRSAELARRHVGVTLHTHVAETLDEEQFCIEKFGCRPIAYMEDLGWVGPDVWYAHVVHANGAEIRRLAETGTGVAHCPTSNMRLGSGIAPVQAMRAQGVRVGLAVDGSASNDSSHLLAEARQALLLQRVLGGAHAISVAETLDLATLGGAAVLGRDDIGALVPGQAADFIALDLNQLGYAGAAVHDPVGALLLCAPASVAWSVINGRIVVEGGQIPGLDMPALIARHNAIARQMAGGN
ncbi:MAG: 8-oxoguanine deaminase [Chloroflexi bacterium]|nr:8-oxoguanine deaminase [Chloroflexota bacterium]